MKNFITDFRHQHTAGFILPIFLITTLVIAVIIVTIMSITTMDYRLAKREYHKVNAQLAADAGLDEALVQLTSSNTWSGSAGEITLLNSPSVRTTYQTVVSPGTATDKKILGVTAKAYAPSSATEPSITRKYEIDVQAVTSGSGPSSVVTGVGGLILNSNAKISGGDVVVNGRITLNNNAQIGLSTNPVNVRVAHQNCPVPPNATFPRACANGENGQPITMGTTARIYAEVHATNQTNGTNMTNPGLIAGQNFDPFPLPTYDRAAHIAAVTSTYSATSSTIACGNNGTKSWPANVKITGNITLGNNCTITLNGNVWVTGNVTMGSNAKFVVSNSLGSTAPVFMIDGGNTAGTGGFRFGNNSAIIPNTSNTGIQLISFWSAAACSPECTNVTGQDLANSQNVQTINLNNNSNASYTTLWSRWSKVVVANNGSLGAVTGQTIELGNNAVINFTSTIPGSSNLITTWVKRGYMRTY